jgi:hypothetical protein
MGNFKKWEHKKEEEKKIKRIILRD